LIAPESQLLGSALKKTPPSEEGGDCLAQPVSCAAASMLEIPASSVAQEESADHQGYRRHHDGIPEAIVDVARCRHHGCGEQRQHAAEPTVADVIGQRHGGVADPG